MRRGYGYDAWPPYIPVAERRRLAEKQAKTLVGIPGQGPSYDESLGEAVQNASKAVQKALQSK